MKKRVFGHKFGRGSGARRALFRSLIRALVAEGRIETSKAKAKTTQKRVERLVNLAKGKGVSKRRQVYAMLGNDRETTDDLFNKIAQSFVDRVGGYTRIINLGRRRGDASEMARLEWVKEIVGSRASSEGSTSRAGKKGKGDEKPAAQKALRSPLKALRKKGRASSKK